MVQHPFIDGSMIISYNHIDILLFGDAMLTLKKNALRREIHLYLINTADSLEEKSRLIRERLLSMDVFLCALQSERLMSYVSMPLEIITTPLCTGRSIIVPCCEAEEIVPMRIRSLSELEPSGSMKILEPTLSVREDESRRVMPDQIDVVLVPGLAFDRFGNRLGRGKGFYDRFLRRLSAETLTIGLALDGMFCERVPCGENDYPVKMIITETGIIETQ